MKKTNESNESDGIRTEHEKSRREAIKKLGKFGTASAVVTAVVYSGFQSKDASAGPPPPPPPPGLS